MTKPVRLQLSRRKGFCLKLHSYAANGLEAVKVARPGRWGNPYRVGDFLDVQGQQVRIETSLHARTLYRDNVAVFNFERARVGIGVGAMAGRAWVESLSALRGKNLACWCKSGPCHADILLALANPGCHFDEGGR